MAAADRGGDLPTGVADTYLEDTALARRWAMNEEGEMPYTRLNARQNWNWSMLSSLAIDFTRQLED